VLVFFLRDVVDVMLYINEPYLLAECCRKRLLSLGSGNKAVD